MRKTSRREALGLLGVATGAAVMGTLFTGKASAGTGECRAPKTPWPYEKLDPVTVAERAYKSYYVGHCMYGAFEAIIGELADRKGFPYNTFPVDMMKYGVGGVADWGTLCGSLNGGAAAIFLVSPDPKPVIDELFGWYQEAKLPDYRPKHPKFDIATSVARSTLCHVSVSKWCKASGLKAFSKERAERCAWITASVAKHTVELLNNQAAGTFKAVFPIPAHVKECRSCHDIGGALENTRGKIDCSPCHFNLGTKHK